MGWAVLIGMRCGVRVESLADHPELVEQVGLLRWKEWAYVAQDATPFIEVTTREAGRRGQLPMTLVAIDAVGGAVGAVGLCGGAALEPGVVAGHTAVAELEPTPALGGDLGDHRSKLGRRLR